MILSLLLLGLPLKFFCWPWTGLPIPAILFPIQTIGQMGTSTTLREIIQDSINGCLNSVSPGKQNIPQYWFLGHRWGSRILNPNWLKGQKIYLKQRMSQPNSAHLLTDLLVFCHCGYKISYNTWEKNNVCVLSEYCSNYSSLSPPWEEYEALLLDWPWPYDLLWPVAYKLKKLCANPQRRPYKALPFFFFFAALLHFVLILRSRSPA